MTDKTHPSQLPLADAELASKLLDEATAFVTGETPIAFTTGGIMSKRLPLIQAIQVTEYVLYMASFAVAEKEANKLGFTLRKWSDEEITKTKEAFEAGQAAKEQMRDAAAGDIPEGLRNVIDELAARRDKKNLH